MKQLYLVLIILTLLLSSCAPQQDSTQNQTKENEFVIGNTNEIKSFEKREEVLSFIKQHQGSEYGIFHRGGPMAMGMPEMADDTVLSASSVETKSTEFSETNNQVQGVDEGDILKTDGEYIYTVTDQTVFIIKAYPTQEGEVVSSIDLDNSPEALFIKDDTLVIMGTIYQGPELKKLNVSTTAVSYISLYSLTDRTNPQEIKTTYMEGTYSTSRLKGEELYLIVQSPVKYRPFFPLPIVVENNVVREISAEQINIIDREYDSPEFIGVHRYDISGEKEVESILLAIERGVTTYLSENLYLLNTHYIDESEIRQDLLKEMLEGKLSTEDKEKIQRIKAIDADILSKYEKENKIMQVYTTHINYMSSEEQEKFYDEVNEKTDKEMKAIEYVVTSNIHKISLGEKLSVSASGKVPGQIQNQFNIDEHNSVLRIATTVPQRWSGWWNGKGETTESENIISTLDENLNLLDQLKGIAKTESIFSVRFMGERLYMVTFRQIDPFFVFDVSNPNEIKELGELKIPGFSRYLHPYDENTIIGIGRDATEQGRVEGLKISLFDVSTVAKPIEVASYIGDSKYAHSSALYEHKAFLFSREKNLLVIPLYQYEYGFRENEKEQESYAGALVFNISKDDIELRGLVSHGEGSISYDQQVERSLFIENVLYTKSRFLLRMNDLTTLEDEGRIKLTPNSGNKFAIY